MLRKQNSKKIQHLADDAAEERILDALLPTPQNVGFNEDDKNSESAARQSYRKKLREGELDDREVEIEIETPQFGSRSWLPQEWRK
ncbi:MAG: hypothetical protein CM1200mP24_03390 [Gammaproteobacteria bacterium]|nr:MAG: hypothetical protein CM1200mP24_03390 [Gammaproteobacteria bacterium]